MKRALTREQYQDSLLVVFTWASRHATATYKDDAKALAWLEPQFGAPAKRKAIHAAVQRVEARRA